MALIYSTAAIALDKIQEHLDERKGTQRVLKEVQCVFQALEPWANAACPHPKGNAALKLAKREVISFSESLTLSSVAARLCYNCADNGIMILESLLDASVTLDELRRETERTVEEVTDAKLKLSDVVESLRTNRIGVFEARRCLEDARADIKSEKAAQEVLEGKSKKKIKRITTGFRAAEVVSAILLAAAAPVCPPLLIAIPIILPLLEFASHGLIAHEEKKVEKRLTQVVICADAVNHMQWALTTLERLEGCLDSLNSWWGEMEMVFTSIHANLETIREVVNHMRMKKLIKSFSEIKTEFLQYNLGILMIQDHYSRDLKKSSATVCE